MRPMRRLREPMPWELALWGLEEPRGEPSEAYMACWSRGDWWKEEKAWGDAGAAPKRPYEPVLVDAE